MQGACGFIICIRRFRALPLSRELCTEDMQEMSNKETNTYSSREQRACVYACIPPPGGWLSEIKAKSGICYVALSNDGLQTRTVFRGVFNVNLF